MEKMRKKLILASASPRRRQLLAKAGLKFDVIKSDYDEDNGKNLPPKKLVLFHAFNKAMDVSLKIKEGLVIGADTVVVLGNEIIGKPKNDADAKKILKKLSGKTHEVITGFVLFDVKTRKTAKKTVITKVFFNKISDEEIDMYLKEGEHNDKAGAYAFQGKAKKFIKKVQGSKTNVIGLPMDEFLKALEKFEKD